MVSAAKACTDADLVCICAFPSHSKADRAYLRERIGAERVTMGQSVRVGPDEIVAEVVTMGGDATIEGDATFEARHHLDSKIGCAADPSSWTRKDPSRERRLIGVVQRSHGARPERAQMKLERWRRAYPHRRSEKHGVVDPTACRDPFGALGGLARERWVHDSIRAMR